MDKLPQYLYAALALCAQVIVTVAITALLGTAIVVVFCLMLLYLTVENLVDTAVTSFKRSRE